VRLRVLAAPVARVVEERRRRVGTRKWGVVADIDPQPSDVGLPFGHDRHGGVVAVDALGGENVRLDALVERHQRERCGADLVSEGRDAERHAFAGEPLSLAVERLVLPVLLEQQHCQEARPRPPTRHDMERRGRLADGLAVAARDLLAHRLDDLPRPRDHLEGLGHVFSKLRQARATTGGARAWRRDDDALAGQMLGERLPDRPSALERGDAGRVGGGDLGGEVILAGVGFEILELEFHLLEQAAAALGTRAVLLASELRDLQFEVRDDRLNGAFAGDRIGGAGFRFVGALDGSGEQRLQRFDIVRKRRNDRCHGRE
jgi:hypothetical protein